MLKRERSLHDKRKENRFMAIDNKRKSDSFFKMTMASKGEEKMSKTNILPDILQCKRNRSINTRLLQIHTPNRIIESHYVNIGGIDQWVTIRGEDYHNPILLFIHGGPASTYSVFSQAA